MKIKKILTCLENHVSIIINWRRYCAAPEINQLPDSPAVIWYSVWVVMLLPGQKLDGRVCLKGPQLVQECSIEHQQQHQAECTNSRHLHLTLHTPYFTFLHLNATEVFDFHFSIN